MYYTDDRYLLKYFVMSAIFFFIGTLQGVIQVIPPVRHWLDSIGSPYGGPGHMIDPLAHAHINLVGGVTLLLMAISYYIIPKIIKAPMYSHKLSERSFWWTCVGVGSFYTALLIFGGIEGQLWLHDPAQIPAVHHYYGPVISIAASIIAVGFWSYLINILQTVRKSPKATSCA